ncbi:hypothetical protein G6F21_014724 [Rhizopus arrhizus]|nr:hypothetical protein G6F21_014724 [Rhizopus arrhizus]
MGTMTAYKPSPRGRRRAGMTCSSFTSARSADSSMPPTEPVAAVRSVMATASASSSSSSSGGKAWPGRKA